MSTIEASLTEIRSRVFSHENLLVFPGQEPGKHFILMDQNQIAPYVRPEPFPLFEHASGKDEFEARLRRSSQTTFVRGHGSRYGCSGRSA